MPENRINYDTTDGRLDDLYLANAGVHIERMSDKGYSILITDGERSIHLTGQKIALDWQHPTARPEDTK